MMSRSPNQWRLKGVALSFPLRRNRLFFLDIIILFPIFDCALQFHPRIRGCLLLLFSRRRTTERNVALSLASRGCPNAPWCDVKFFFRTTDVFNTDQNYCWWQGWLLGNQGSPGMSISIFSFFPKRRNSCTAKQ